MVIDSLYYGDGHHHAIENASFTFSVDVLATFLRKIYKGFDTSNDFEPTMWREILRVINEATVEGLVRGNYNIDQGKEFLKSLAHSNEVFSAFKVHDMGVDMAKKLVGSDGKLKPFAEWKKDVAPIASHYCGSWLQTEYNTAVLRGQFAAEWKQYEADKDIMPNLRWMPTTSATPDDEHKGYWQNRLTLPVEDKFWNDHHPGDHWNCKCSLEQTDDPSNPEVLDQVKEVKPQKGLKTNPGKSGKMFDETHPYFVESCKMCWMKKGSRLANIFNNANDKPHCNSCDFYEKCAQKHKEGDVVVLYESPSGSNVKITKERMELANSSKQEMEKYQKEIEMCKVIANNGINYFLRESLTKAIGDTFDGFFDGVPSDLKQTKGSGNIVKYIRKATQHQGAKVVIFAIEDGKETNMNEVFEKFSEGYRKYKACIWYYKMSEKVLYKYK